MDIHKRVKDAVVEAAQSEVRRWFQEHRKEIAGIILDIVPDAHMHSAASLGRFLPRIAQMITIATPEGPILDVADDIVQDMAQAIKEEAALRTQGGSTTTTTTHSTEHRVDSANQYARFLLTAATLEERQFDALLAWYDSLEEQERERLFYLCAQSDDAKLAALLKQPLKAVKAATARVTLPKKETKPKTYLEFREEVRADVVLCHRVSSFLSATGVKPVRFWKFVARHYGNTLKDKAEFARLMNLGDDEIFAFLHLGDPLESLKPVAAFCGDLGHGARVAGAGIALGARSAGRGIGDFAREAGPGAADFFRNAGTGIGGGARTVGNGIVRVGEATRDAIVDADDALDAWGLRTQAVYPPPRPAIIRGWGGWWRVWNLPAVGWWYFVRMHR